MAVEIVLNEFFQHVTKRHERIDVVVALDARGFLFGPTLALRLKARFVPVRKAGKVRAPQSILLVLVSLMDESAGVLSSLDVS